MQRGASLFNDRASLAGYLKCPGGEGGAFAVVCQNIDRTGPSLRLALGVALARVVAGRPPRHDFVSGHIHRFEIVIPAACR